MEPKSSQYIVAGLYPEPSPHAYLINRIIYEKTPDLLIFNMIRTFNEIANYSDSLDGRYRICRSAIRFFIWTYCNRINENQFLKARLRGGPTKKEPHWAHLLQNITEFYLFDILWHIIRRWSLFKVMKLKSNILQDGRLAESHNSKSTWEEQIWGNQQHKS